MISQKGPVIHPFCPSLSFSGYHTSLTPTPKDSAFKGDKSLVLNRFTIMSLPQRPHFLPIKTSNLQTYDRK
ncbi:hypothetical protein VTN00DRAFT_4453 [Thermoascus crustaceus]|uniref:uncharacterized protein n=1 Tax=Thermoascus crustaceus TaxID=5088 RepID=UPI003742C1E8